MTVQDKTFYLLSDGTGETAELILSAAIAQFSKDAVKLIRIGHILSEDQVIEQLSNAEENQTLVFYTFVNRELAKFTDKECKKHGVDSLDLISPILSKLSIFFGHSPEGTPGLLHEVGEEYYDRMEAMEFTLKNDDGQSISHLEEADIILVGVSRSSKTPLSIYLSCRGFKVVNIPLVGEIAPPQALLKVDPGKVCGLFLEVNQLLGRREIRVKAMGVSPFTDYIDYDMVKQELRWARALCRDNDWKAINVTGKSVEESAHEVLVKLKMK